MSERSSSFKFKPREPKPKKYQVRFWAMSKDEYQDFVRRVRKNKMIVQDVFNQFMEQYL